jgi:hypothetical protein
MSYASLIEPLKAQIERLKAEIERLLVAQMSRICTCLWMGK